MTKFAFALTQYVSDTRAFSNILDMREISKNRDLLTICFEQDLRMTKKKLSFNYEDIESQFQ